MGVVPSKGSVTLDERDNALTIDITLGGAAPATLTKKLDELAAAGARPIDQTRELSDGSISGVCARADMRLCSRPPYSHRTLEQATIPSPSRGCTAGAKECSLSCIRLHPRCALR
jgi:hypothetical protein